MLKRHTYLLFIYCLILFLFSYADTLSVSEIETLVSEEEKIEVYSVEDDLDSIEENSDVVSINEESGVQEQRKTNSCNPPCRKGYICVNGECISVCNPPCPPGYVCDTDMNDCVPIAQTMERRAVDIDNIGQVYKGIKIDGSYKSAQEIKTVSSVYFNLTNILYGIGTGYSAIVPLIIKEVMKTSYEYDYDYYNDGYYNDGYYNDGYYNDGYYNDGYYNWDAIMCLAPQTGMFVTAGAFNQGARSRQRRYLRALGEEPNGGLTAASWILYAASIHTANWNVIAQTNDGSDDLRTTSGIVNLIALFSSYVVSNVSYYRNKSDLEKAVNKNKKLAATLKDEKKSVSLYPYYSYDSKNRSNRIGFGLNF